MFRSVLASRARESQGGRLRGLNRPLAAPVGATLNTMLQPNDLALVCLPIDLSDDAAAKLLEFLHYQAMARCLQS